MKFLSKHMNTQAITDRAASGIAKSILKSQSSFANYLQSVSKNWKARQQWIFLYLVCLCFGGLSIAVIVNPLRIKNINNDIIPKSMAVPKNIYQQNNGFAITENELRQVQEYKSKHPNLQQERRGLFDSLSMIEEVYYS